MNVVVGEFIADRDEHVITACPDCKKRFVIKSGRTANFMVAEIMCRECGKVYWDELPKVIPRGVLGIVAGEEL